MTMRKHIINVPNGMKYLTEKNEFESMKSFELPNGILNKVATGCGATTLALKDEHKTIICSPRNRLLENKHEQHPDSFLVVKGVNEADFIEYMSHTSRPKILSSFEGLKKLKRWIVDKSDWRVVLDEFQFLLLDAGFKPDVECETLELLKDYSYVTHLSATPLLDKYLEQLDNFKNIDYYELQWEAARKIKIEWKKAKKPIEAAAEIMKMYKDEVYPKLEKGIESKECVIFLNSVTNIANLIKATKIQPEEVNIIVARTSENENMIEKLGVGFEIGRIPLKGEKHKKITLCTSTVYAGCDFYSENALTFVVSDCHKKSTTVDIATELVQIAGRQRLENNPFRNFIVFIYNSTTSEINGKEFETMIRDKWEISNEFVESYNSLSPKAKLKKIEEVYKEQRMLHYDNDYIMYNEVTEKFEANKMAYLYERYAYDLQHIYKGGITVIKEQLKNPFFDITGKQEYIDNMSEQVETIISKESFADRMKRYCEYRNKKGVCINMSIVELGHRYPELKDYYETLGGDKIKDLHFKEKKIINEISDRKKIDKVCFLLDQRNIDGQKITTDDIKRMLSDIYAKLGMKKAAVATNLQDLYGYEIKYGKVRMKDGSRKGGYEIKKVK